MGLTAGIATSVLKQRQGTEGGLPAPAVWFGHRIPRLRIWILSCFRWSLEVVALADRHL